MCWSVITHLEILALLSGCAVTPQYFRQGLKLIPKPRAFTVAMAKMTVCPRGHLHWGWCLQYGRNNSMTSVEVADFVCVLATK